MQYCPLNEADGRSYSVEDIERVYGIDLFIGEPDWWNKGIGTKAVSLLIKHLCFTMGARRVVIDPHINNPRAIRCYEKCGFKKIKVLPEHEWHEGMYVDCWLMAADC
jgi:aminoglycoside 6'-N-acetyltransferase